MQNFKNKINSKIDTKLGIGIIVVVLLISVFILNLNCKDWPSLFSFSEFFRIRLPKITLPEFPISFPLLPRPVAEVEGIEKFSSEQEFKEYLEEVKSQLEFWGLGGAGARATETISIEAPMSIQEKGAGDSFLLPERVSETTVQVIGIDEPDILKTDGKEIYFSPETVFWRLEPVPLMEQDILIPPYPETKSKIIKAFPPADLGIDSEISKSGNLLLANNILVIFSQKDIYGFDVLDPESPSQKWDIELKNNSYLVGARLYKEKIYLITRQVISEVRPCPIKPLAAGGLELEVKCTDIYHPVIPIPADVTYTAMILNPSTGAIEKNVSFVGSSQSSVVYVSEKGIYITYSYYESIIKFLTDFFKAEFIDIVPLSFIQKLERLESYDISQSSKLMEFSLILEQYLNSLDEDEKLRVGNEFTNRMDDYYKEHMRDLEKTGIVKIGTETLEMQASGSVPGYPLNQFALDEYNNYLRIATTVGERWGWGFGVITSARGQSANDVYVLDSDLKIKGSVKDLGVGERIYSVRFIEDKGYVVTFRQIDPFYVLDLSNPQSPELAGELKIPGYSSYLHPITKDKILGIGKEDWEVKVSLFDVSSPENPKEIDKYILDEYWSEILNTHHAFLLDKKHEIFFLPGSKGGYVFSYKDDKLSLVKAVSQVSTKRAIYIDDYLYIISDREIIVLNELNWEKINEIEL